MKSPIKTAIALLIPATMLLGGCGVSIVPGAVTKAATRASAKQAGAVRVQFAGLAAYKTLATSADIDHVTATLTAANGASQTRKLDATALRRPQVFVDFNAVGAGNAKLEVLAYDANDTRIGEGNNTSFVAAGATTDMRVRVAIDPNAGMGNVQAIVTFDSVSTPPADDRVATFRKADADNDGYLALDEYRTTVPAYPMMADDAKVQPTGAMPIYCGPIDPPLALNAGAQTTTTTLIAYPPCRDQVAQQFNNLDLDHDGRLTLVEFLGAGVPTRVAMVPDDSFLATPGPDAGAASASN